MKNRRPISISVVTPSGEVLAAESVRAAAKFIGVRDTTLLRFMKRNPDQGQLRLKKLRGYTITVTTLTQEQAS